MTNVSELINKAKSYTTSVRDAVAAAKQAYEIIVEDIRYALVRLDYKQSSFYPNTFATQYARSMITEKVASKILATFIETAADSSEEFSREMYKTALLDVADDDDIFVLSPLGDGWNISLNVNIVFEASAGSIADWAHGIEGYRDALGVEVGSNRGLRATNWWFKRVYRDSQLSKDTFEGRLAYAGRPAPFWQILNSGSTSLPSDRKDGSYNPVPTSRTNFIGDAEDEIRNHFKAVMINEKAFAENEIRFLKDSLSDAYEIQGDLERLIDKLKADENLDRFVIEELSSRSKSGDISQYADEHKLREAVRKARAGEDFNKSRIELTAKGAAKRVRPRVQTLVRLVEGFEEL